MKRQGVGAGPAGGRVWPLGTMGSNDARSLGAGGGVRWL